ncbi:hypothetical protein N7539_005613 [Penicillium diatomitis]|uniref:Uncharacterized protein n=1 Tax=Penicillium diatomitis TaxID=2819901 RepID=A0A9X0BVF7_9EURO|nr:uncharacterized protein N7539_005613 [Penicillium diatomitis]KAJ5485625.1 hypothetical protein N7539_005613 [Penicillium diatomitis]
MPYLSPRKAAETKKSTMDEERANLNRRAESIEDKNTRIKALLEEAEVLAQDMLSTLEAHRKRLEEADEKMDKVT